VTKHILQIYQILLEEFGPQHWWPGESRDEVIIGAILTQNTNWTNVEKAIANLKLNGLLTLKALSRSEEKLVADCIRPTGFYNRKAQRLVTISKAMHAKDCISNHDRFRLFLLSLTGIGPETADSILLYAYELPFFVVDAYTKRIFSRLGFVSEKQSYQAVQHMFTNHLEPNPALFNEYHALIVKLAKTFCRINPICRKCPLNEMCEFHINSTMQVL